MSCQSAVGDGDIEQRPFYSTYVGCLFKSKRDSIIIGVRILEQPFTDVLHYCCALPTSITKGTIVPCCYHLGYERMGLMKGRSLGTHMR